MKHPRLLLAVHQLHQAFSAYSEFLDAVLACRSAYGRRGGEWGVMDQGMRTKLAELIGTMADSMRAEADEALRDAVELYVEHEK